MENVEQNQQNIEPSLKIESMQAKKGFNWQ